MIAAGRQPWTVAVTAAALLACGGRRESPPPAPATERVEQSTAGDVVVATVDGRPVLGSCARDQMEAFGVDAERAVADCIDFELLAIEAERRGYSTHPAAVDVRRREAVRALLRTDFEATHGSPADIPADAVRQKFEDLKLRYDHPEYRYVVFARAPVPRSEPRGSARDREAEARMRAVYRALLREQPLSIDRWRQIVKQFDDDKLTLQVTTDPINAPRHRRWEENFAAAAFAIPAVGHVSRPTRTRWGWDIILLTKILPEEHRTLAEVEQEFRALIFRPWQKYAFEQWLDRLMRRATVWISPDVDRLLAGGDPLSRDVP
ncbi:MAG: hypothetical protein D6689_15720 [Deltaproteobacteria bacterium]|nr:MAG: hypothetical protein D6689_15720 [Deltaproteobacteria bacterium]